MSLFEEGFELGYAAALIEGEGNMFPTIRGKRSAGEWHSGACVKVSMTDIEPLLHMHRVWGGRLNGPYQQGIKKPYHIWSISTRDGILSFAPKIQPYLSRRRQSQLVRMIASLPEKGNGRGAL